MNQQALKLFLVVIVFIRYESPRYSMGKQRRCSSTISWQRGCCNLKFSTTFTIFIQSHTLCIAPEMNWNRYITFLMIHNEWGCDIPHVQQSWIYGITHYHNVNLVEWCLLPYAYWIFILCALFDLYTAMLLFHFIP